MPDRYADIIARCLEHEDKAHRDAVLAEYDPEVRVMVASVMQGLARRLANSIIYAGRKPKLEAHDRQALRNMKLDQIEPDWLRRRVEMMVREHFDGRREKQQQETQL